MIPISVQRLIEEYADHKPACLTRATLLLMDCDCGFVVASDDAQAALGAGERECANPEQHRCVDYHRQEDEITDLRARLARYTDALNEIAASTPDSHTTSRLREIARDTVGSDYDLRQHYRQVLDDTEARLAAVEAKRDAREAEVARLRNYPTYEAWHADMLHWKTKADALAAALARYGRHEDRCHATESHHGTLFDERCRGCTCGLDTARAGRDG